MKYTITFDLYGDDTLLARIDVAAADKKEDAERMFNQLAMLAEVITLETLVSHVSNKLLARKKEERASREEQHARYIDCGPQNWDDRD